MITSIFSKSKPLNFIIAILITLIAFFAAGYMQRNLGFSTFFSLKKSLSLIVCFASVLLLNFIVSKNKLSKTTNYEIILYSLFLLAFFTTTNYQNILFANFFVLLALRRIISVRSQLYLSKKFFDAAFWITIAGLFYFWSVLFFLLILAALVMFANKTLRYWFIPFVGVLTVLVLTVSLSILVYDTYFGLFITSTEISFDYSPYFSASYILLCITLFLLGTWAALFYLNSMKQKEKTFRASFNIIFLAAILAFLVILLTPNKNGSEFLFLFAPLSIIVSNYIEVIDKKWFKDVFLSILILVPIIAVLLQLT